MALSKLKAFADDIFHKSEILKCFFDTVENVVGKGVNAGNLHFLLFPKCFLKVFFRIVIKNRSYDVKGFPLFGHLDI